MFYERKGGQERKKENSKDDNWKQDRMCGKKDG